MKPPMVLENGAVIEMCQHQNCVLAADHPEGQHRPYRVSQLACPHNVPNFGPGCRICDKLYVRTSVETVEQFTKRQRRHDQWVGASLIETVEQLDELPEGTVIQEVEEAVTWVKEEWRWRCIGGFVPGTGRPLLPAGIVGK